MRTNTDRTWSAGWALAAVLAPTMMLGCYGADDPTDLGHDDAGLIASVVAEDVQVDFLEPIPGEILLVSDGDIRAAAAITDDELGGLDAVDLYERMAGEPAPDALLAAQRRSDDAEQLADDSDLDAPAVTAEHDPAVGKYSQLTATEFSNLYCPGGSFAFWYCRTNRTGLAERTEKSEWAEFTVHSYRGTVSMELEIKGTFTWNLVYSATVVEDQTRSVYSSASSKKNRRVTVNQAAGDGYHYAFYGGN